MIFKSRKSLWIGVVLGAVVLLILIMAITTIINTPKKWFVLLPLLAVFLLPIWLWFDTFYQIGNAQLKYRSAFIRGSIDISNIREVIVDKTWFVGLRPALAFKGLIVKYNRWDEIYISPEKETVFFEELLKVNPKIKITKL